MSESGLVVSPHPAEQVDKVGVEGVAPPGVVMSVGHLVELDRVTVAAQRACCLLVVREILLGEAAGHDDRYGVSHRSIEPAGEAGDTGEPRKGRLLRV